MPLATMPALSYSAAYFSRLEAPTSVLSEAKSASADRRGPGTLAETKSEADAASECRESWLSMPSRQEESYEVAKGLERRRGRSTLHRWEATTAPYRSGPLEWILSILGWFSVSFRAGCKIRIFLLSVKRLIGLWRCFFYHIRGRTGRGKVRLPYFCF